MSLHLIFWATPHFSIKTTGAPNDCMHLMVSLLSTPSLSENQTLLEMSCLNTILGGGVLWNLNLQLLISMIRWNSGYLKKSLLFASPQFAGWTWTRDKSWASFLVPFSNKWASSNLALLSCSFKHLKDHGKHGKVVCCWVWFGWPLKKAETACCLFGLAKWQQLYVRTRNRRFFNVTFFFPRWQLGHFQGGSVGLVVVEGCYFTN